MSERMTPLSFEKLIKCAVKEYTASKSMFGVHRPYMKKDGRTLSLFGENLRHPLILRRAQHPDGPEYNCGIFCRKQIFRA